MHTLHKLILKTALQKIKYLTFYLGNQNYTNVLEVANILSLKALKKSFSQVITEVKKKLFAIDGDQLSSIQKIV